MKPIYQKLFWGLAAVAVLALAFWYGGNAPGLRGWSASAPAVASVMPTELPQEDGEETLPPAPAPTEREAALPPPTASALPAATIPPSASNSPVPTPTPSQEPMVLNPETGKDQYLTDPVPEGKPIPVEPGETEIGDSAYTCTLSVRCDTILDNMDWLDREKWELVPEDGIVFPATEVTFYQGEGVFDLLLREMKGSSIHMEFVNTPIYNSAYIEAIHNLYEFDCGEGSGWMYKVNDWFPNYGCSRYALQPGDRVEWVYTCDLGGDVGGSNRGA